MAPTDNHVQEMQGLYGPFTIAERVVQKIWLRRDFDQSALQLHDGRVLTIRTPGTWNLLGGPDFREARLVIDGLPVIGDIEVHFHVSDWWAHGHADDRAYDNVVLHVVLFPSAAGESAARRGDGREIPTLVLLPWLHRSLEEHASDDALEGITARDAAERIAELAALPRTELNALLLRQAEARWKLKQHFAALRIRKLGWTGAAHHTALEILGYRHNRAAMLTVATMYPLPEWGKGVDPDELYAKLDERWQLQGVRPANYPRLRLRQYHRWVTAKPDWPETLRRVVTDLAMSTLSPGSTALVRKETGLPEARERIAEAVLVGAVAGSRFDTLVCDGFLPLVAAETGRDFQPLWFHWFMGDVPVEVRGALGTLGIAGRGAPPFCHGWAQGLLGWMAERDLRASG
ncbi:MAG TPA: DUF2851 family protein [Lacunisphaera sp.]